MPNRSGRCATGLYEVSRSSPRPTDPEPPCAPWHTWCKRTRSGNRYTFSLEPLGNVCIKGNKANISFDERFLATHHYNEPADYVAGADPDYREKGSSDVTVVDFVTGKKQVVTKMGPGQFALYAHFRSDGWLYFLVVDHNTQKYYVAASDWAIRQTEATPTP